MNLEIVTVLNTHPSSSGLNESDPLLLSSQPSEEIMCLPYFNTLTLPQSRMFFP